MNQKNDVNWPIVIGTVLLVFLVGIMIALWNNSAAVPVADNSTGTPAAAQVTTARPASATPEPERATDLVIAYWSPNGQPLPKPISVTGATRLAAQPGWVQIQLPGANGGQVWIEQADAIGRIPDLPAPAAAPGPAVSLARATQQPEPCKDAGSGDQVVTVCGWGDLDAEAQAAWVQKYGGSVGNVATVTPYPTPTLSSFYTTPPQTDLDSLQKMIGDDPNAPACMGANGTPSPICGGVTNAEAQAALDARRTATAAATK